MASSKDYLTFVLEQLSDLDSISYRAMMGEYILYYRDKIVGGIYDDRLLVKPVSSAISLMPTATYELPYEGAKEMLLVDDVDSREFLCNLFLSMYDELPAPKKKNPPPKNSDKKPLAMSFIPTAKGFVYNMDLFVAQPSRIMPASPPLWTRSWMRYFIMRTLLPAPATLPFPMGMFSRHNHS